MAEPLGVTPSDLRGTSKHLEDVSTRMKDALASLRENLRAEGSPWVGGKVGEQFEGDFRAQLKWVDKSVAIKTDLLDYYSKGLKHAADSFDQQDQA